MLPKKVAKPVAKPASTSAPVPAKKPAPAPKKEDKLLSFPTPAPIPPAAPQLNKDEHAALSAQQASVKPISVDHLNLATDVVLDNLNLRGGDYRVAAYLESGNKIKLTLDGDDFTLAVTIKDASKFGITEPAAKKSTGESED